MVAGCAVLRATVSDPYMWDQAIHGFAVPDPQAVRVADRMQFLTLLSGWRPSGLCYIFRGHIHSSRTLYGTLLTALYIFVWRPSSRISRTPDTPHRTPDKRCVSVPHQQLWHEAVYGSTGIRTYRLPPAVLGAAVPTPTYADQSVLYTVPSSLIARDIHRSAAPSPSPGRATCCSAAAPSCTRI
ncbi:hypothetical protein NDU88_003793 [Pleurodeles waltl]|uniref:Uncharacterized protein n=1 Tax=Pleurodeles waltl TaxID=8319 RepID=A0AAV7QAQ1_PLEWA|nr:hypothetical protein NDU88_003793 [Pleurodeles waltl]